jgi:WD40 repeat protein
VWFSNDERTVYGTSTDGSTYVLETATGDQILRLLGHAGTPIAATMSHDGRRMATFADDFTARAWDLTPTRSEGATYIVHTQPRVHLGASADLAAGIAAVWGGDVRDQEDLWETTVFDLETEETLAEIVGGVPALSPDGSRLAYRVVDRVEVIDGDFRVAGEPGQRPRLGPIRVMDLATKEVLVEIDVPCVEYLMPDEAIPSAECRDPLETAGLEWDLEFSSDGRLLAMADSHDDEMTVWDAATGDIVGSDRQPGANVRAVAFTPDQTQVVFFRSGQVEWSFRVYDLDPFGMVDEIPLDAGITFAEMEFTPDGSLLVAAGSDGDIALFDTSDWRRAAIRAHQGSVLDVAIDPEGTLIASAGGDGFVRMWDLASRSLVTEIEFDVDEMANVEFIDDTHLLVTSGLGSEAIVITLDPLELLAIARERLTRTFTAAECATYVVDPCPTLEEVKSGNRGT